MAIPVCFDHTFNSTFNFTLFKRPLFSFTHSSSPRLACWLVGLLFITGNLSSLRLTFVFFPFSLLCFLLQPRSLSCTFGGIGYRIGVVLYLTWLLLPHSQHTVTASVWRSPVMYLWAVTHFRYISASCMAFWWCHSFLYSQGYWGLVLRSRILSDTPKTTTHRGKKQTNLRISKPADV